MPFFSESLSGKSNYEEFKYVLQDRSTYGFGARLTYAECLADNDVPFKFRAIIEHYILKDDISADTSLESHLYYMKADEFAARTYVELKAKVRVWMKEPVRSFFSKKTKYVNKERVISVGELMNMDVRAKKEADLKIGELILSKLALMGFSV